MLVTTNRTTRCNNAADWAVHFLLHLLKICSRDQNFRIRFIERVYLNEISADDFRNFSVFTGFWINIKIYEQNKALIISLYSSSVVLLPSWDVSWRVVVDHHYRPDEICSYYLRLSRMWQHQLNRAHSYFRS